MLRASRFGTIVLVSVLAGTLLVLTGCKTEPPGTLEEWIEHMQSVERDEAALSSAGDSFRELAREKMEAGEDLSHLTGKLIPLLEGRPRLREQAAWLLGHIGDPQAVGPLADAIDYGAGRGQRDLNAANIRIAEALGRIGTPAAVPPLARMTGAREAEEALAAVQALGATDEHAAVSRLSELATADDVSPFISRRAIEALGAIGHPDGLPALIKMLFKERQGVSFYREASFSVFQLGADAGPPLIEILEGRDEDFMEWARKHNIRPEAVYAKAAQVLGDLADNRAAPGAMRRLGFESEYVDMQLIPRMFAADALGRLRHRPAVRRLTGMLDEAEANTRERYIRALAMIGDRSVLPALIRSTRVSRNYDAREFSLRGVARMGGPGTLSRFDDALERASRLSECLSWFRGDEEAITKQCKQRIDNMKERSQRYRAMLVAAEECSNSLDCWLEKLEDENPRVREKAAWELGWSGEQKALDPLLDALQEPDLDARFAMVAAVDTLLFGARNDKIPPTNDGKRATERLRSILDEERGRAQFVRINEDLRRLELKIQRAFMHDAGEIEEAEELVIQ